ncbi:MAG: aconitate hydratase, partial [Chloroflexi bacterium]|nr:aconitate hydratase [Chloroflexota bacterium]
VHQVNLEYLANVVESRSVDGEAVVFPDTLVGTDSHTTMVNGLGVLGWGVGGIEAEAAMLGQPMFIPVPEVIGVRLVGALAEGVTATDLVLTVTQLLRARGVVDRFVEFFGPGLSTIGLADRATIANMAPEYGATCGYFPVDAETLRYLRASGRSPDHAALVERYSKEQGLFRTDDNPDPVCTDVLTLDLGSVEPSLAGPRRPQDRVPLSGVRRTFRSALVSAVPRVATDQATAFTPDAVPAPGPTSYRDSLRSLREREAALTPDPSLAAQERGAVRSVGVKMDGQVIPLRDGAVAIAAITSCTNTSNPSVMVAAGLVARRAVERGLRVPPWVKTSLAPGSRVVIDYLERAELLPALEQLGFHLVGFGCTTCIGNSGPLPDPIAQAVKESNLVVAAVLSGNRNFEGRVNPLTRLNYLASPPLVVAYALAGTVDVDLRTEPIGADPRGNPVYLRDLWPSQAEIRSACETSVTPDLFQRSYGQVSEGDERWRSLPVPEGDLYRWDAESTYIQEPPFLQAMTAEPAGSPERVADIRDARILAILGDSVTTDHISPASSIPADGPAGRYLIERGVQPRDFNSFGARRGNHEVMVRGTFGNIRLRNLLTPDAEGNWTIHFPSGERTSIYEAAMRYQAAGTPTIVIAGQDYGMGSSRDWAAKGVNLLGVRAVIAESYERIHRANLVGMGVLPLQFRPGESPKTLGLVSDEVITIAGLAAKLEPRAEVAIVARRPDGSELRFTALSRLDGIVDVEYYRQGGILPFMLRRLR